MIAGGYQRSEDALYLAQRNIRCTRSLLVAGASCKKQRDQQELAPTFFGERGLWRDHVHWHYLDQRAR